MGNLSFSNVLGKGRMIHLSLNVLLIFGTWTLSQSQNAEEFSEELLLKPLPDGKVLTHFHFTNRLPPIDSYGHHHRLFPKAIYQLVQKFKIQEMEVSFTHGRWNYDQWGGMDSVARSNAKPSGVELWAVFGVPDKQIDATWRNLTHALSGLFCASLNFLESPAMIAKPVYTFRPHLSEIDSDSCNLGTANCRKTAALTSGEQQPSPGSLLGETAGKMKGSKRQVGRVRYGALPREAVCTENLTPWLKLLPCRDKAGLTTLLERPVIYKGWYHSLRLYVRSEEFEPHAVDVHEGTLLQQTLTLVIKPSQATFSRTGTSSSPRMQPSWSLSSLFGRRLSASCPLATSSVVYVEFEGLLVEKLEQFDVSGYWKDKNNICMVPGEHETSIREEQAQEDLTKQEDCSIDAEKDHGSRLLKSLVENDAYVLHGIPTNLFWGVDVPRDAEENLVAASALLAFAVPKHENVQSVDIGISWKVALAWTPLRSPFRATRFLVGRGNARGAIAIVLKSNQMQGKKSVSMSGLNGETSNTSESSIQNVTDVMIFQVVPWYIRLYLHTLQVFVDEQPKPFPEVVTWMHVVPSEDRRSPGVIEMKLRIPCNVTVITLITEFDKGFLRIDEHPPDANRGFDLPSALISFPHQRSDRRYQLASSDFNKAQGSPLLQDFQKEIPVQVYTEVLLVPLATPDFSMPYNVITLTCTVLALYFGSLLNILRRRIGEEERLASSREVSPVGKLERLFSRLFGLQKGREESSPSKLPGVLKFIFVAVVAVAVNYYFANR